MGKSSSGRSTDRGGSAKGGFGNGLESSRTAESLGQDYGISAIMVFFLIVNFFLLKFLLYTFIKIIVQF